MACEVRDTLGGHFVLLNVKNGKVVFLKKIMYYFPPSYLGSYLLLSGVSLPLNVIKSECSPLNVTQGEDCSHYL